VTIAHIEEGIADLKEGQFLLEAALKLDASEQDVIRSIDHTLKMTAKSARSTRAKAQLLDLRKLVQGSYSF
jgi:hypothetical protein